jgi:hypothetical protein
MTNKEAWEQLVASPGWALLCHQAKAYWQDQLASHLAFATNDRDDLAALNKVRQIVYAKQAIDQLLQLPQEELRRIEQATAKQAPPEHLSEVFSRRGGL